MHLAPHSRVPRPAVPFALPLLLGVIAVTLTQCRMVGDNLTGVRLFRSPITTCIKDCNDTYKLLFDEEQKLHKTNVEECLGLTQPDRAACLQAEDARHSAEMERLSNGKAQCQRDCQHQGGGGTR